MRQTSIVRELLRRGGGMLKLRPTYVHRFYPDFDRLGQRRLKRSARQFIPERWIGSSIAATNPPPLPAGGMSMVEASSEPLSLRDVIRAAPHETLGEDLAERHGNEFRVLVKILDPGEAIVFHLHATDEQVREMPRSFRGHRFGKDEAYYFLEAPKGPMPYTHAGLYEGVTRRQLVDAVKRGPEHALELSPPLYQEFETGLFVPAGVPHRPGTALTLEIQQLSDVCTLLETHAGGKALSPEQMHPGFKSLDEAFALVELKLAKSAGRLDDNRLKPQVTEGSGRGGEVAWVFPLDICRKFGGKRLRVQGSLTYREASPFVLLAWRGAAKINGMRIRRGEELFVTHDTAAGGIEISNSGDELFEGFTFFPGA